MKLHPRGIITATLTPYGSQGEIDLDLARRHAEWLVESGVDALAPAGTTGESLYLAPEEAAELTRTVVAAAAGRVPVVAGIWSPRVDGIRWLARMAVDCGASAVFLTTPIYYPASDEVIFRWYETVREVCDIPIYAYHIPQYAVNAISGLLFRQMLEAGVVDGIKDSSSSEESLRGFLDAAGEDGAAYGAGDAFAMQARELGARGFISALGNIYPRHFQRIWNGEEQAQEEMRQVRAIIKHHGGIGALKALLSMAGFGGISTRLPFGEPSPAQIDLMRAELTRIGLLPAAG